MAAYHGAVQRLRLTHRDLDRWVEVRLRESDGKWLAGAGFADEPDAGTGTDPEGGYQGRAECTRRAVRE
jgi:hypothetical protein